MVASRFYIAMVGVRFPLKVQKYLYWRNWYTAIESESSGNSPEMVTGSNPVYKSFNLGSHVPRLAMNTCNVRERISTILGSTINLKIKLQVW